MKKFKIETVTKEDLDRLSGKEDSFVLLTKSFIRKVSGFERNMIGSSIGGDWLEYRFDKSIQMSRGKHRI